MSVDITATVVIEQPIESVAAFAGDPSNAPQWHRRIVRAEWQTEPPIALGSRITFHSRFLGRELTATYQVSELTADEQVAMTGSEGPFPTTTTSTWRRVGDRVTHMTLRTHIEPTGWSNLLAPLMKAVIRRTMRHDLDDLKQLLESD